jgi:hypothetical protein
VIASARNVRDPYCRLKIQNYTVNVHYVHTSIHGQTTDAVIELPAFAHCVRQNATISVTFPANFSNNGTALRWIGDRLQNTTAKWVGSRVDLQLGASDLCPINNAANRALPEQLIGEETRDCSIHNGNRDECLKHRCQWVAAAPVNKCVMPYTDAPLSTTSLVIDSNRQAIAFAGAEYRNSWRVTVTGLVLPPLPGDPGHYHLNYSDVLHAAPIDLDSNPNHENTHINSDVVSGMDCGDVWLPTNQDLVCAIENQQLTLSFVNYHYLRHAARGKRKHQIIVQFPPANESYTFAPTLVRRPQFTPLDPTLFPNYQCGATDMIEDWSMNIQYLGVTAIEESDCRATRNLRSATNWLGSVPAGAVPLVQRTGYDIDHKTLNEDQTNALTARWDNVNRRVVIETYAEVPRGRLTFVLGDVAKGFTIGHPLNVTDISGIDLRDIGPAEGVVRYSSNYTISYNNRTDDMTDLTTPVDTTRTLRVASNPHGYDSELQCHATTFVDKYTFRPARDVIRSGICDFDVVPSKCSPSAQDVWLTFSFTADRNFTGVKVQMPSASFTRSPKEKCYTDPIPIELLSMTSKGRARRD